ncbi:MAG: spore coat protein [Anaerotignum sp.]
MQLTEKEKALLRDLKEQEQVCVEKYSKYSTEANDTQLQALFSKIGQAEQQHLDTINQILNGTIPQMQSGGNQQKQQATFTQTYTTVDASQDKKNDCYLCTDLLANEKHVSGTYNICIFEFKNTQIRDALNHIQKEEQEHGEQLYQYMAQNGMYS